VMSSVEQEARAKLRLGFLNTIKSFSGKTCVVTTFEGNKLDCVLVGIDRDSEMVAVENLQTPTGMLKHALLRISDIDVIKFNDLQ
jgi:hypothetical protein